MSMPISQSARDLARRTDFVFLSTLRDDGGFPETRTVFNLLKQRAPALATGPAALPAGFATWIATNTSSQKVRQARKDARASLYFVDTATFEGLSLLGTLEEILDPAIREALWVPQWEPFYPGGLHGGDFTVLAFHPARGRYYHGLQVQEFDATTLPGTPG